MIRLTVPTLDEDDFAAVRAVLKSGYLVQGPRVIEFEQKIAAYVGVKEAVAVTSATAALFLSLDVLELKPAQKVAVTSYSWPSTSNVISLHKAEPVFVDIDPCTFNIDPKKLEEALEEEPDIVGILPVHAFGQTCNMSAICAIARKFGVWVLEDAACALGGMWDNRPAGSWGNLGCFSFHPRKAITTGEGGIITTDDESLAEKLRILRNHGMSRQDGSVEFLMPAHNFRMTEMQGALGCSQLDKLDTIIESRRKGAEKYNELFAETSLKVPKAEELAHHVYQTYVVILPPQIDRNLVIENLKKNSIESTIGTYHLALTKYQKEKSKYSPTDFPHANSSYHHSLSLPLYHGITKDEQETVARCLLNLIGQ